MDDRMREMINAVKKYSVEHWNEDGWDIVAQVREEIVVAKSPARLIHKAIPVR